MQPLVDFLAEDDHASYRYLTFGFGDQLAYLSRLTEATTIDGSYHTARTLPELRNSGIGQIDSAYWIPGGMSALDPILSQADTLGVRWGFVNLAAYRPVLQRNGWVQRFTLTNGIEVWENPTAVLPPPVHPAAESPFAEFSWGAFPLYSLFIAVILAIQRYLPASRSVILTSIQSTAISLLPMGLSFWYYRELFIVQLPRIYFTYSDVLFFTGDGLALVIVVVGLIRRLPAPGDQVVRGKNFRLRDWFRYTHGWLFGLCVFATLSIFWSLEKRTAVYFSLHLWLCYGLFLTLKAIPRAWFWFAVGCWAVLGLQTAIASAQFLYQSTEITNSLGLNWPGNLNPSIRGASVVQLTDGARWLRAYGTLPHPNVLGGFALAMLIAPLAYYLVTSKRHLSHLLLLNAALVLILLTFSRSAWTGMALLSTLLVLRLSKAERKKLLLLGLSGLITLVISGCSLRSLFITRLGNTQVQTEQASIFTRTWLIQRTLELIQINPLLGTGIGSHPLALSQHVEEGYPIEPVHNIPLLVMSELGVAGTLLLGGLALTVITSGLKAQHSERLVFSIGMLSLLLVSCFDHYFWTLAPGRLMFVTLLGLWAGQVTDDESRN